MMYSTKLSETLRKRLMDVTAIQVVFLRYAAFNDHLSKEDCKNFIEKIPKFQKQADNLTQWLWSGSSRLNSLVKFAEGPANEKQCLVDRLAKEIICLASKKPRGTIEPFPCPSEPASWQEYGGAFVHRFYDYMYPSKGGLPNYFFTDFLNGKEQFYREDIEKEFELANEDRVAKCPACGDGDLSEIDHYFPQFIYSHLSCHPYNLVPMCRECNGYNGKHTTDILQESSGARRNLENVFLPYHDEGFSQHLYLKFYFPRNSMYPVPESLEFSGSKSSTSKVKVYSSTFKIIRRWNEELRSIHWELDGELKQKIKDKKLNGKPTQLDVFQIRDTFDRFIFSLGEDQGKRKWSFLKMWYLANLINIEIQPVSYCSEISRLQTSEFFKRIGNWSGYPVVHPMQPPTDEEIKEARRIRMLASET